MNLQWHSLGVLDVPHASQAAPTLDPGAVVGWVMQRRHVQQVRPLLGAKRKASAVNSRAICLDASTAVWSRWQSEKSVNVANAAGGGVSADAWGNELRLGIHSPLGWSEWLGGNFRTRRTSSAV